MVVVVRKWAKTNTNTLDKKKQKNKRGKINKNSGTSSSWQFKTFDLLHDCLLNDQVVVDEASEMLKSNRKNKIDAFMDGREKIMTERGH